MPSRPMSKHTQISEIIRDIQKLPKLAPYQNYFYVLDVVQGELKRRQSLRTTQFWEAAEQKLF